MLIVPTGELTFPAWPPLERLLLRESDVQPILLVSLLGPFAGGSHFNKEATNLITRRQTTVIFSDIPFDPELLLQAAF